MNELKGYKIYFKHRNALIFEKDKRIVHMVALPPCINGCDIISFNDKVSQTYTFNFQGFILVTNPRGRKLFYEGNIIARIKTYEKF
jgi:hypothetical protein